MNIKDTNDIENWVVPNYYILCKKCGEVDAPLRKQAGIINWILGIDDPLYKCNHCKSDNIDLWIFVEDDYIKS